MTADLPPGNAADAEGQRNEYIVSTLTEEKESGVLYFAHRSFQEFLVAERMLTTQTTPGIHVSYSRLLTPEILVFLRQSPTNDFIFEWYETLRASRGPIGAAYLEFFASFPNLVEHIQSMVSTLPDQALDAWTISILFYYHKSKQAAASTESNISEFLLRAVRSAQQDAAAVATLALIHLHIVKLEPQPLLQIVAALLDRCLTIGAINQNNDSLIISRDKMEFSVKWLRTVIKEFPASVAGAATLKVSLSAIESACVEEISPGSPGPQVYNPLGDLPSDMLQREFELVANKVYQMLDRNIRQGSEVYLKKRRPRFGIVEVGHLNRPKA